MNYESINQTKLYCLDEYFFELVNLHTKNKLPNKILLSGEKGIGKSTLAYHFINYILSNDEEYKYDTKNLCINHQNKSYILANNNINQNLIIIDVLKEKKNIDISQIRELITKLNKSTFNDKQRFILIDNIELLNLNSVNALLKILEEPTKNTYFILINNNKKVLSTLSSRCLDFKIFLPFNKKKIVIEKLLNDNLENIINLDFISYYSTPGQIYNLIKFSKLNDIDLTKFTLQDFLLKIIKENYYKKDNSIKFFLLDLFESYLLKKNFPFSSSISNRYSYFIKKFSEAQKYNLDEESLFIEFKSEVLNG